MSIFIPHFFSFLKDVVDEIADIDTDQYGFPLKIVRVIDCGVIHVKEPYHLPHPTGNNSDTE